MRFKPSDALRFLGGLALAVLLLGLVVLRVTSCAPAPRPAAPAQSLGRADDFTITAPAEPAGQPIPPPAPMVSVPADCQDPAFAAAARANAASLRTLPWAPFRRPEVGWETYAPMIARETGAACAPDTPGFARALADWQRLQRLPADGVVREADFVRLKGIVQTRRPFVQISARGVCPDGPDESTLATSRPGEGYGGKVIQLRPAAFAAYRQMAAAARRESPAVDADPRNLTIFSGYRSPASDAARCLRDGNCNGVVRATCSPHRTGLAMDVYVGQAPGFGPDSTADPNRLAMSKNPAYLWLLANAHRFGFVNYPFEPWHWEWTGEAP